MKIETQKIPIPQSGSPNLLSPQAMYAWYHMHHGLQDMKKAAGSSTAKQNEQFNRVLSLYYEVAKKYVEQLRPQLIHDESKFNEFVRKLESRLDNKLRVDSDGKRYILINGKIKFDGTPEVYEEHFQSGKKQFMEVFKAITSEIRETIFGNPFDETDKALILDDTESFLQQPENKTVAVDLDNTIIDPNTEQPLDQARESLQKLRDAGFEIAIYTARFSFTPKEEWQSLLDWISGLLNRLQIPFDKISIEKPVCSYYIDDRSVKFTNWPDVMMTLNIDKAPSEQVKPLPETVVEIEKSVPKNSTFKLLTAEEISRREYQAIGKELW